MDETPLDPTRDVIHQAVMDLAHTCESELAHTQHVTALALRLFDETQSLHQMGRRERDWLEYAGLLHDIGWVEGAQQHHKSSLRIILSTSILPFGGKERLVIGSIARYHRRAEPSEKHDHFKVLEAEERRLVVMLSALLKLADGLDSQHLMLVQDITAQVGKKSLRLTCWVKQKHLGQTLTVSEKGALFEKVFNRKLDIKIKQLD